jgi:hypothetical protein
MIDAKTDKIVNINSSRSIQETQVLAFEAKTWW